MPGLFTPFLRRSLFLTVAALAATPALQAEEPRTISTSGESTVYVAPDEAVLSFGISTVMPELTKAKAENDAVAAKLTSAVKTLGIEPRYFATDNVSVSLRYSSYESNNTSIAGYNVSRSYMVTLKDLTRLQAAVDTVLNNGANVFEGVTFRSTEMRKHRDTARSMAVKAAKEKAVALASELDCTVGSPRTITESANVWAPGYARRQDFSNITQNSRQEVSTGGEAADEGVMPLGQMGIKANVSVTFDLIPKPV